jgi:AraC-like DNA-binding protein
MSTLTSLLRELRLLTPAARPSGVASTHIPGVTFFWDEQPVPRSPLLYDTGLVIIGQGYKQGYLGGRRYRYDVNTCLILGIPVPFECEAHATPDEPLLGLRLDIDLELLHSLVARLGGQPVFERSGKTSASSGVEPVNLSGALLAATTRLVESLRDPIDSQVVGAAAREEIIYRILRSEQGRVLYDLTQHHTPYASIARALARMHKDYQRALSVEELARESLMGVSSFHRAFKQVTGESPVQYLKKIRLLKAKALLVFEGARVEEAAYEVGYASASQFSREFKRYFNVPPSEAASLPYSHVS